MPKLIFQTVYPDGFEQQKVPLVANIFNQKKIASSKMNA